MREFLASTTALVCIAIWSANLFLDPKGAFVVGGPQHGQPADFQLGLGNVPDQTPSILQQPATVMQQALGMRGLICFGMGFGALAALARRSPSVSRRAAGADIAVKEKTESKPVAYLDNIPRSIIDKKTLDKLLATLPREQWDNPPEDSYLNTLKAYAETYGEGKATKMGWWDFWYLRINQPNEDGMMSMADLEKADASIRQMCKGEIPLYVPGPAGFGTMLGLFDSGAIFKWRGAEPFAGDLVQTPVTDGGFAKQFIDNCAFYREGLKPWQRGLEIGMAHGYFLIGPFVSLGPLRNTPEAATVGLVAGCALIGIVSVGALLLGATIKPTLFDKKGDAPAAGWQEMINWHALGGLGGAGFAHALITVFGA